MSNVVVLRAKDIEKRDRKRQKKEENLELRSCDDSGFLRVRLRLARTQSFRIVVFSIFTSTSSALTQ